LVETSAASLFLGTDLAWIADEPPMDVGVLAVLAAAGALWIAEQGTEPAGFIALTELDGAPFVLELSVARPHQGLGLGGALLAAAVDHARWTFQPAIALTTYRDVPWNKPFYARRGFVELRTDALGPGLAAKLAAEAARGHDPARRCAMAKVL